MGKVRLNEEENNHPGMRYFHSFPFVCCTHSQIYPTNKCKTLKCLLRDLSGS